MSNYAADHEYPYLSDSDDEGDPREGDGLFRDPHAEQRANEMMEAMSQQYEKENEQMNELIATIQRRKEGGDKHNDHDDIDHDNPQEVGPFQDDSEVSDLDADLEHQIPGDELEASFRPYKSRGKDNTADDYPPGEGYDDTDDEIDGYDPKIDGGSTWTCQRLCVVSMIVIIAVVITIVWVVLVVVIGKQEKDPDFMKYIPKPPLDLNEMCAPQNLQSPHGILECRTPCHNAACCWSMENEVNPIDGQPECLVRQPIKCSPYQVCHNLLSLDSERATNAPASASNGTSSSSIPTPPNSISECVEGALSDVGALLLCEDACNRAPCCWKDTSSNGDLIQSCSSDKACEPYAACDVLKKETNAGAEVDPIPSAPSDLETQCKPVDGKDTMDSVETCIEYCSRARCCWESTVSETVKDGQLTTTIVAPKCEDRSECSQYQPCKSLEQFAPGASTPGGAISAPVQVFTSAPAASPTTSSSSSQTTAAAKDYDMNTIYDACYNHDLSGANGQSLCAIVCELGSCCYDGSGTPCSSALDCGKYQPCSRLTGSASSGSNAALIAEVSTACGVSSDLADCVQVCSAATCCFTNDLSKTCELTKPGTVCEDYKPCEVLYKSEMTNGGGGRGRG